MIFSLERASLALGSVWGTMVNFNQRRRSATPGASKVVFFICVFLTGLPWEHILPVVT